MDSNGNGLVLLVEQDSSRFSIRHSHAIFLHAFAHSKNATRHGYLFSNLRPPPDDVVIVLVDHVTHVEHIRLPSYNHDPATIVQ